MNIKQKISVVLAASILLPTAVSAAEPLVPGNGEGTTSVVSEDGTNPKENGKENPPEPPKDSIGKEKEEKEGNTPPVESEDGRNQPGNPKNGETIKDPEVKEDNNVFLFMKAITVSNFNGRDFDIYALVDPNKPDFDWKGYATITEEDNLIYGLDWTNIDKVKFLQTDKLKSVYSLHNTTEYIEDINRENESIKYMAKSYVNLDNLLNETKKKEIDKLNETIKNPETSEEDKSAAKNKIQEIESITIETIDNADENIKNTIINDPTYESYKSSKKEVELEIKPPKSLLLSLIHI